MTDSYPALIELIGRLEGKDRKTCELALYCLLAADRRDARLRRAHEELKQRYSALVTKEEKKND